MQEQHKRTPEGCMTDRWRNAGLDQREKRTRHTALQGRAGEPHRIKYCKPRRIHSKHGRRKEGRAVLHSVPNGVGQGQIPTTILPQGQTEKNTSVLLAHLRP